MRIAALAFAGIADAATGYADLEMTTYGSSSYNGFNGVLNVYLGKNCMTNPTRGYICDYKHQVSISQLQGSRTYQFRFPDQVNSNDDQILMTYRDNREAIFDKIKLTVGSTTIDLKKLDGGGEDHSVFDFDTILKPCGSSYPRGSHCSFDKLYDLFTSKVKPHYSLFSGHVVKYNINQAPRYETTPYATTSLHFKTGGGSSSGTDASLMIYYGINCNSNLCSYTKEVEANLVKKGTNYDYYLPDFDFNKDQLIMDFRDSDGVDIDEMVFTPCNGSKGCQSFNLLAFGTSSTYKVAFDYDDEKEPCSGRYGDYNCMYDAVYDFKDKKLYKDKSVIKGQ